MKLKFTALGQLLLLIGLAVPHACSQLCVPPPQGMISWWTGDGTTLDYFGLNNGPTASPVSYAAGEVADAFSFNGSQYVQVPRSPSLEPAQITVDAWVNATGSPGTLRYIVAKGALDNLESSYALYTGTSGGLQFYVFDGTNVNLSPDAGTGVWDGKWHHIAGTYDQTAVRLFLDGTEVGTGTPATTSIAYGLSAGTDVTNDLFFGDYNPACSSAICHNDLYFIGEVDEIEIFERALQSQEIAAIFTAGQAGKCLPVKIDVARSPYGHWGWDFEENITVAILGSAAFDAGNILQPTLRLFPAGDRHQARAHDCRLKDLNDDTFPDLVCRFYTVEQRHFDEDGTTLLVTGQVSVPGGQRTFFGTASIDLESHHGLHGEE